MKQARNPLGETGMTKYSWAALEKEIGRTCYETFRGV
jgi:hypothetical protein